VRVYARAESGNTRRTAYRDPHDRRYPDRDPLA